MNSVEAMPHAERWALRVRRVLVALIASLLALIVFAPRQNGAPALVGSANASLIAAAPGCIALSAPQAAANFYIIDTNKQVVCVYQTDGEKIRLVSAREYSQDMDIFDSSAPITGPSGKPIAIEGNGTGVTRTEAQLYAEGIKRLMEDAEKKKP